MRRSEVVSTSHRSLAAVRGENNGRCHWRLQQRIQVCETLDVEHVYLSNQLIANSLKSSKNRAYLVNEHHTRYNLGDALVDIALHDPIDLAP